eukprot:3351865-Amphidinium_carterae.2
MSARLNGNETQLFVPGPWSCCNLLALLCFYLMSARRHSGIILCFWKTASMLLKKQLLQLKPALHWVFRSARPSCKQRKRHKANPNANAFKPFEIDTFLKRLHSHIHNIGLSYLTVSPWQVIAGSSFRLTSALITDSFNPPTMEAISCVIVSRCCRPRKRILLRAEVVCSADVGVCPDAERGIGWQIREGVFSSFPPEVTVVETIKDVNGQ